LQCQVQHSSIDRISTLSDEILLFILSLLTLEDAAKTSILSRRWRHLWSFTPTLDFDVKTSSVPLSMSFTGALERALEDQRRNYVRWVDSVIMSHKAYTVEKFRLFFNLTKLHQQRIDEWLRHALARKVRTLELDLTNDCCRKGHEYYQCYTFPYELLRDDSVDFKFLEKLCTHYVNVKCEAVEFFLRNCPRLEHLSICRSGDLKTLKIIRPFPALKRVEISLCHALESFEIRDAGVVYLKYEGKKIRPFVLENVSLLTQLCIEGSLTYSMADVLSLFSSLLPQLEYLRIFNDIGSFSMEESELFYSGAKLTNLKELVVKYWAGSEHSWLPLANFIRAAPYLDFSKLLHCKLFLIYLILTFLQFLS
ncbi:putative F-box/LRR-repeat protein at5g02700, partial [Phtheirospermum japonicum]